MENGDVRYLVLPRSLPSADEFERLVARYKEFRLLSLKLSPECFGSSHAREAAFPPETWVSRISNPGATNIVAVSNPSSALDQPSTTAEATTLSGDDIDLLLSREWLASITLIGPLEPETALDMYRQNMHLDPDIVDFGSLQGGGARWHFILNAMYVIPAARGKGLGRGIIEFAKNTVLSRQGCDGQVRVVLIVDYDNETARILYERCGFAIVHRYWFDDARPGRGNRTEAAVMQLDLS